MLAFNPEMLRLARLCAMDMTQSKLATEIGVSQGKVSKWEDGLLVPSDDEMAKLSLLLKFPVDFFFHPGEIYGFGTCLLFHRKRQAISGKYLNTIHARMNVVGIGIEQLLTFAKTTLRHPLSLPRYGTSSAQAAEQVARKVRSDWGLHSGPISNLMSVAESAGVIIVPMDFGTDNIDAISVKPRNTPPLIFSNVQSPADRQRFTLAHELGHLVMHNTASSRTTEIEADRFASELLMPSKEIRAELSGMTIEKAKRLKQKWRTAMSAIIKRAKDTGAISDYRARMLFIEMNPYRKREPVSIDPDVPGLLEKIIEAHRKSLKHSDSKLAEITFCRDPAQFEYRFRLAQRRLKLHE
jgi:Zn-dependent peptidase ImmA (M78 family)/DNA-binding XRE family transcriptional regulator